MNEAPAAIQKRSLQSSLQVCSFCLHNLSSGQIYEYAANAYIGQWHSPCLPHFRSSSWPTRSPQRLLYVSRCCSGCQGGAHREEVSCHLHRATRCFQGGTKFPVGHLNLAAKCLEASFMLQNHAKIYSPVMSSLFVLLVSCFVAESKRSSSKSRADLYEATLTHCPQSGPQSQNTGTSRYLPQSSTCKDRAFIDVSGKSGHVFS